MKIEVQEFYEDVNKRQIGTMHVYVEDFDMDIRGIIVAKTKTGYFFALPSKEGEKNGKRCRYPIINIVNHDKHLELVDEIRKEGTKFLGENYGNKEFKIRKPQKYSSKVRPSYHKALSGIKRFAADKKGGRG